MQVDISTPAKWVARRFFWGSERRAYGVVLAFCPTAFVFGAEAIVGEARGAALLIGPFWVGVATIKANTGAMDD